MLPSLKLLFEIEEKTSMARIKRGAMTVSILLLVSVIVSACDLRYSTPPAATNTPLSPNQNFFSTPIGQTPSMSDVEVFGTGTALALTGSPVPGVASITPAGVTPQAATSTPTPAVNVPTNPVAATPTATQAVVTGPTATLIPSGSRPATYTLQNGEYPYCIARRFNVDPDELLVANGLVDSQTLYAGKVLTIPQTGNPFPGSRMWHNHPDTYTVDSSSETVYGVACYYGDIDPALIAQANGISVNSSLTVGQRLTIP
jgi:LysM repeat protein